MGEVRGNLKMERIWADSSSYLFFHEKSEVLLCPRLSYRVYGIMGRASWLTSRDEAANALLPKLKETERSGPLSYEKGRNRSNLE